MALETQGQTKLFAQDRMPQTGLLLQRVRGKDTTAQVGPRILLTGDVTTRTSFSFLAARPS